MKAVLLASAVLLALPLAAAAQPRVITTQTVHAGSYHHEGPVILERSHPVRHRVVRHRRPVHHRRHPVIARHVEHHPNGVTTTTIVRR